MESCLFEYIKWDVDSFFFLVSILVHATLQVELLAYVASPAFVTFSHYPKAVQQVHNRRSQS